MYRFNSVDGRLDRSLETALLIMESFRFFDGSNKFEYRISGHSGDGPNFPFVREPDYPKDEKQRAAVLKKMLMHSQFCLSGDNTMGALSDAIKDIAKEEAGELGEDACSVGFCDGQRTKFFFFFFFFLPSPDDYFVVLISDANIEQYNINTTDLSRLMKSDSRVNGKPPTFVFLPQR
jgi:hypothetical protein